MKHYLILAFKSMFLFLIVCWSAALSLEECVWIETISFYFLALYEVKGSKESKEALVSVSTKTYCIYQKNR